MFLGFICCLYAFNNTYYNTNNYKYKNTLSKKGMDCIYLDFFPVNDSYRYILFDYDYFLVYLRYVSTNIFC